MKQVHYQNGRQVWHDYASPAAKYQGQGHGGCGMLMLDAVFYSLMILAMITALEYAIGDGLLWAYLCHLIRLAVGV